MMPAYTSLQQVMLELSIVSPANMTAMTSRAAFSYTVSAKIRVTVTMWVIVVPYVYTHYKLR